jgi:hypothetical protein
MENIDHRIADSGLLGSEHELSIGSRIDDQGVTTYHVTENDKQAGICIEKIYDGNRKLITLARRCPGSRSETTFDPLGGAVLRLHEYVSLHDGNSLTKEVIYGGFNRATESIILVAPNGELVRKVERTFVGKRTTYQGQTEYDRQGAPTTTVNHHLDETTGRLMRREQIQWLSHGRRWFSEFFYFDQTGGLSEYSRVLYHAAAGPFIEEIKSFDSRSQCLIQRKISAFDRSGKRTRSDVLTYNDEGEIADRQSRFFDKEGREIACGNPIR